MDNIELVNKPPDKKCENKNLTTNNRKSELGQFTIKRLLKDNKEIIKNPLDKHGIYYQHSDEEILKGHAVIIGPEDTPYHHGFYMFEFTFPSNYPFAPPVLKFLTNDGIARMHPNLYRSGKVCVSILNTWAGEQWSGCQTISSILLTLVSLLTKDPLIHEPGFSKSHRDCKPYNHIITYKNYSLGINHILRHAKNIDFPLYQQMKSYFVKNYQNIINNLDKEIKNSPKSATTTIYGQNIKFNYENTKNNIKELYDSFS